MVGLAHSQANDLPDPGILPDSPFYFLKSWSEEIGTLLTFGEEKKAERFLNLSEKRLSEARALAEKGRGEMSEKAMERYENQLNSAMERAERAKERGIDMDELLERISERTLKHQEVLADVYERVPEEAREGIERAMENSMRGHEEALRAVSQERREEVMERIEGKREEARQRMDEVRESGVPGPDISARENNEEEVREDAAPVTPGETEMPEDLDEAIPDILDEQEETGQIEQEKSEEDELDIEKQELKEITLSEAQEKIGMECIGSDVSMDCAWSDAEYSFFKPANWESDKKERIRACEEGWINRKYNMVTDGHTWYATTNFEKDNAALQDAFSEIGFESEIVPYCR